VIVVHLLAMAASMARETPPGAALRAVTMPWEKVLGVHQTWPMFAEAPRATNWLVLTGLTSDGTEVPIHALSGEPGHDGLIWVYDRLGKLERNAVSKDREYLRASVVRGVCATVPEIVLLRIDRVTRRTPHFRGELADERSTWPTDVDLTKTWRCRR
jgi:hypothetical protein